MSTHFISVHESDFLTNASYNKDDKELIKGIIDFLEKIEYHTIEPPPVDVALYTMLNRFLKHFPVQPTVSNSVLVNIKKFIKKGSYGNIYYTDSFDGVPLITKLVRNFETNVVRELFINYIIINSILLSGIGTHHFVPTYGIFICQHAFLKSSRLIKKLTGVCNKNSNDDMDRKPNLHMVQERIDGDTLDTLLKENSLTCIEFHRIVCSILKSMILLEESPYRLYHSDLHCGNIMIDQQKNVYIIDFGFCSFTYKGVRYRTNFLEREYSSIPIYSAAYDITFLLIHSYQHTEHPGIQKYIKVLLKSIIFDVFWQDVNKPLSESYKDSWLYDILYRKEKLLSAAKRKIVHQHNMEAFNNITYRSIYELISV